MDIKVTVIVPIYNVEKYAARCIDSIICQTYTNLEIILVNDGSTDKSLDICKHYKTIDKRIKIIDKKNGGLSDARNAAIDVSTGEYLFFVDGDDFIEVDLIYHCVNDAETNNADIVTYYHMPFADKPIKDTNKNNQLIVNSIDGLRHLMYQKSVTTSAWGKLYRKSLFKDIRYPFGKICEDLPVTYRLFDKVSNKIVINSCKKYYYFQRNDSIINSKYSDRRFDALGFAIDETKYIQKRHPELRKAAMNREFMEAIYILEKMPTDANHANEMMELKKCIKRNRMAVICSRWSSRISRYYAIVSFLGVKMLSLIIKKHTRSTM